MTLVRHISNRLTAQSVVKKSVTLGCRQISIKKTRKIDGSTQHFPYFIKLEMPVSAGKGRFGTQIQSVVEEDTCNLGQGHQEYSESITNRV